MATKGRKNRRQKCIKKCDEKQGNGRGVVVMMHGQREEEAEETVSVSTAAYLEIGRAHV